jgi:hypothetical protein
MADVNNNTSVTTFHLLVEGRYIKDYWLRLEVPAATSLQNLDRFLRGIWLECCGHMSAFTIQGACYSVSKLYRVGFGKYLLGGPLYVPCATTTSTPCARI